MDFPKMLAQTTRVALINIRFLFGAAMALIFFQSLPEMYIVCNLL